MLVAGFAGSLLVADRWKWMYLAAGVFAGLAYYSKGSEILLLGMYPVMAVLACGWRSLRERRLDVRAEFLAAVLVMAPFWYSNYKLFGNPLHSTQNYVSGFFSFESWDSAAYFPYWGHHVPKTSDRWTKYGDGYLRSSSEKMMQLGQIVATGTNGGGNVWVDYGGWGYRVRDFLNGEWARTYGPAWLAHVFGWSGRGGLPNVAGEARATYLENGWAKPARPVSRWRYPAWELSAAGAVLLCVWMVIVFPWTVYVWVHRWLARRSKRESVKPLSPADIRERRLLMGPVAAIALLFTVQFVFLCYFWDVEEARFAFLFLPLLAALGVTGFAHFAEIPLMAAAGGATRGSPGKAVWEEKAPRRWVRVVDAVVPYWHVVLTIVFAAGLLMYAKPLQARYADWLEANMDRGGYPFEDSPMYPTIGKWVHKTMPKAVIMCRNPWEIMFYAAESKGVSFPKPEDTGKLGASQVFAIARYYHVQYVLNDEDVPESLTPYMLGRSPGLKRVRGLPGAAFFEIDWSKIQADWTVEKVFDSGGTATVP